MILTSENYYSREANMEYMSVSQFKAFSKCEAAAMAELRGEYEPRSTTALMLGSYIDAFASGELSDFTAQHPEIFKRDGTLKSDFAAADVAAARIVQDDLFCMMLCGRSQVIRTGMIAGVPFKIKMDSLLSGSEVECIVDAFPQTADSFGLCSGAIVDTKYMRDMAPVWSETEGRRVSFVEGWGYDLQGAVYQTVEGHMLPFFLAVVTKEQPADIRVLSIGQSQLDAGLCRIEEMAPRYQKIKRGEIQPERCEKCAYCRQTRRLTSIMDYKELELC